MLNSISVTNFKSFGEATIIDLAPITLIYGANSSGKSSILQSLLLLRQTLLPTTAPTAALLFRNREFVDLGNFENCITAHNKRKVLKVGFGFKVEAKRIPRGYLPSPMVNCRIEITFAADTFAETRVRRLDFFFDEEREPAITVTPLERTPQEQGRDDADDLESDRQKRPFVISSISSESRYFKQAYGHFDKAVRPNLIKRLRRDQDRYERLTGEPLGVRGTRSVFARMSQRVRAALARFETYTYEKFIEDAEALGRQRYFDLAHFLPVISMAAERRAPRFDAMVFQTRDDFLDVGALVLWLSRQGRDQLLRLSYIGPLREYPERTYIFSGTGANDVGSRGQNLPQILFSVEQRNEELNALAKLLGIEYDIRVSHARSKALSDVFAVRLLDRASKIDVGLSDVGFGISQILPILLQSVLVNQAITLIEQPEIHLHPRLQAALGEVLAQAINNRPGRQFVIETHSEHLLLRLCSIIKRGELDSKKLRVIFVAKEPERGSVAIDLRIDKDGNMLDHWPGGFFDEKFTELLNSVIDA